MTQLSQDGGQHWTPLPNWSKHSFNTIVPLANQSFVSLGYGTKKVHPTMNKTAVQQGWRGHMDNTTGELVVDETFTTTFTTSSSTPFPDVLVRSGSVVPTKSGGYITTMYGHGAGVYRHWTHHPTVYVVASHNLQDWQSYPSCLGNLLLVRTPTDLANLRPHVFRTVVC